ncbi:MAG: HAD-IC family P-type ATPase, partial [Coriobacteriia bacterium]|nr:HAD-IC family P-type ATPase [Coriobacteriia bacterium]
TIIRENVLTWFNLILGILWLLTILFGSWRDALFGMVLVTNSAIGIVQEIRAKRTLDRLSLLSAPRARVIRDGALTEIDPSRVVLDDVLALEPGDQLVADGEVLAADGLEVDESALTGESAPVPKYEGDAVMSGGFVVAGSGFVRTTAVGADSYAMRIETEGRRFTRVPSEIVEGIGKILRIIGTALVPIGILTVATSGGAGDDLATRVTHSVAALVSMVPEGLVLLSSIAFALAAIALASHSVLVNELPAVEGLARVDVVLTDKTGTLTEREPVFQRLEVLPRTDRGEASEALGALTAIDTTPNETLSAIALAFPPPPGWSAISKVAFASARKWSAADFGDRGVWILGAPDVILGTHSSLHRANELAAEGARVLLLARATGLPDATTLPTPVEPAALVVLGEALRPDADDAVRFLGEEGVALKIISGDNPRTVGTIALAAGVPGAEDPADARTLPTDAAALADEMDRRSVFGRVMPEQKAGMVSALSGKGHRVAMIGDGVNDVLALKQADLGIAMGAGVPAARAVSQVVLLDNRFAAVPLVMAEGRRVIANAERIAKLFLTKSAWAMILALLVALLGVPYPFLPRHITLAGSLSIGIPGFFLALMPNPRLYRPGFVERALRFAVPAGVVIAAVVLGTTIVADSIGLSMAHVQTLATLVLTLTGLGVIAILEWPLSGWRTAVVSVMAAGLALALAIPFVREFFALVLLTAAELATALAVAALATGTIAVITARVRR